MKRRMFCILCSLAIVGMAGAQVVSTEMRERIARQVREQMEKKPPVEESNFARYAEANETAPRGADAVFMGNSITDNWPRTSPDFFADNNYIGRGISGQLTTQMLLRFRADVIALQPKCVVIMGGTNDIIGVNAIVSTENTAGHIFSMCELARAHGIIPIICSVTPVYRYIARPEVPAAETIIELNRMLKEYADREGILYVDYHAALKDDRNGMPEIYSGDELHPNAAGYAVMEAVVKPVIDKALGRR